MRSITPIMVTIAMVSTPCFAANPFELLRQAREAAGGAALNNVAALHVRSTVTAGERHGTFERWEDLTHGRYVRQTALPPRDTAEGFDGVSYWVQPRSGIGYVLGGDDARLAAVDDAFEVQRGWWFPDCHLSTIADAGTRTESDRSFDVVRITPEGGRPFELWFDRATHMVDRVVEQQAEQLSVVHYSDYRRVSGVMLPFTVESGDGLTHFSRVETVQSVEINPAIPDRAYALPALPTGTAEIAGDIVTVPFRLDGNRIIVPVTVDGKGPFEAQFDSGGSLILPPALVADLGLQTQGKLKETGGGEGFTSAGLGAVSSVAIGRATLNRPGFKSFAWNSEHPKWMIVGQEFLQNFVVRFDFDTLTMTLTRPDRYVYNGAGVMVPFRFQDNQPEVIGSVDGVAGTFTVDTGDSGSLLLIAPFARRYGFAERYHATIPYGGQAIAATHGLMGRAGELAINGPDGRPVAHVSRPVTRISQQQGGFDADRYVSANLGLGILKQFNLTFDYPHQRIILEPNHRYGAPDVFDRSGMRLKAGIAGWTVEAVYPEGAAERAGMRRGDTVLSINGKGRADLDAVALHETMTGPIEQPVELRVRAGGSEHITVIRLRDVL